MVYVLPRGSRRVVSVGVTAEEAACAAFEIRHMHSSDRQRAEEQPTSGYMLLVEDFTMQLIRQLSGRLEEVSLERGFMGDTASVQVQGLRGKAFACCSAGLGIALGLRSKARIRIWDDFEQESVELSEFLKDFSLEQAAEITERIEVESRRISAPTIRISVVRSSQLERVKPATVSVGDAVDKTVEGKGQEEDERWLSLLASLTPENKDPL